MVSRLRDRIAEIQDDSRHRRFGIVAGGTDAIACALCYYLTAIPHAKAPQGGRDA